MSAVETIVVALGSAGVVSSLVSAVSAWVENKRPKPARAVTMRITRNDGSSVFLDADTVRNLDPEKLKEIIAEILPDELEDHPNLEDADEDAEAKEVADADAGAEEGGTPQQN
jgi:hypothetical protein